ncbi:hypothetical protein EXIGLDRAFT_780400, partial [Exidia glandulosa HHB12029]
MRCARPLAVVANARRSSPPSLLRLSLASLGRAQCLGQSGRPRRTLSTAADYSHAVFAPLDTFADRHIGPDAGETAKMLERLGYDSMDAFVDDTVPKHIRVAATTVSNDSIPPLTESELLG